MEEKRSRKNLILARTRIAELARIPEPISVSDWADAYRYLSSESSSKQGRWTTLPVQIEPLNACLDPNVESVCLMWSSQTAGKTEILLNILAYHIDHDPCPILVLQPTIEMAETFSKDRLAPMVRDTPTLKNKIHDAKSRDSGNTILHKIFPGGHITAIGANAPAGLAQRPIRLLLCDEVDRYPASAGTEGDPISLAERRTDTFWDAVIFKTSTPTVKGRSRIEAEWNLSDQRYWYACCPLCKGYQRLTWAQVQWPPSQPQLAFYRCELCQAEWSDQLRMEAIRSGEWRATAPFNGKRGYHLNGIYTLFRQKRGFVSRMHQMVANFLEAKQLGENSLRTWVNTFLAETWEEPSTTVDVGQVIDRCESYGPILPSSVLVLVAGVDVQSDRIEIEIVGYGNGEESWGIMTHIVWGSPEMDKVWTEFDTFLLRNFEHKNGHKLHVACCCIDAGYKPKQVYAFCRERLARRVFAVKGSALANMPLVNKPQRSSIRETLLFTVGTDTAKEIVYSRLLINQIGPRYCHFPIGFGYDEEYFAQLTSERVVTEFYKGKPKRVWIKKRERNEALDRRVYALAALEILNPDWIALTKALAMEKKVVHHKSNEGATSLQKNRFAQAPNKGWVNSWKA